MNLGSLRARLSWIGYLALSSVVRRTNTIVFCSGKGARFEGNPRSLYQWMREHVQTCPIKMVWVANTRDLQEYLSQRGIKWINTRSWRGIVSVARAKMWVVDEGWFGVAGGPPLWRRPLLLQLWHGIGPKPKASENTPADKLRKYQRSFRSWDLVLTTSVSAAPDLISFLGVPRHRIAELGYPRDDCLFDIDRKREQQVRERVIENIGAATTDKLVLYAPTYRTYPNFPQLEWATIDTILEKNAAYMLYHPHPYDKFNNDCPEGLHRVRKLDVSPVADFDMTEMLLAFDVLITDFSSIAYDFVILQRPIVFYLYDLVEFTDAYGLNFKVPQEFPGAISRSAGELYRVLDRALATNWWLADRQEFVLERFFKYRDGHSSERVANWICDQLGG